MSQLAPASAAPETAVPAPVSLNDFLETRRDTTKLTGIAVAVVRDGAVVASGVSGVRSEGSSEKVTLADKWHIGSCTKSMTATLVAMLVENGTLHWGMTLSEALPKLAPQMRAEWNNVTIEQLLAHRGGAPHDLAKGLKKRLFKYASKPPRQQRAYLIRQLLTKQNPSYPPGTRFDYSNAGYAIIGHIIEEKLNRPFEDIVRDKLFAPLKMTSAGFGAPATLEMPDQPWGHRLMKDKMVPVPPGPGDDNPAAIGPGGTVHCSIEDLARFAIFHLHGDREGDALLTRDSFRKLHTQYAPDDDYAMGWRVIPREWGGGNVLMHNGTNTMNYAVMWLAPRRDFAVVACTNCYGEGVIEAVDGIVGKLVQDYAPHADVP